ncbi:hypothetical protein [Pararhodobacter sp. SW119]|uniref:hypothetical protein n=1 Tax=Pararhodobacter sp. SW119 TaxID=2780075 RepID=UPI001ADFF8AE|nr:hypothetical protein [Pararhodobacter sp. SW119]
MSFIGGLRRLYQIVVPPERRRRLRERRKRAVFGLHLARSRLIGSPSLPGSSSPRLIVSLTSFPARIDQAWIAIESIFAQTLLPDRIVLVLARSEFGEAPLPEKIDRYRQRGVEILWIDESLRSYNKLLPTREKYPDADIVTIDDDILYPRRMLAELVAGRDQHPETIIARRARVVRCSPDGSVMPFRSWPLAAKGAPTERLMPLGLGGVLYPAKVLDDALLLDSATARRLCPTGDDIWFWAVARKCGVRHVSLGRSFMVLQEFSDTPKLWSVNQLPDGNDMQIAKVIAALGIQPVCPKAAA